MELRIRYAKIEDGVRIAFATLGEGAASCLPSDRTSSEGGKLIA
jgi:hypothetical protein